MTPERQKWWDSLPQKEKELREALNVHRRMLSINKECLTDDKGNAYIAKMVRRQKLLIRAIKHELDRTTTMVYTGRYAEPTVAIYRCQKCNGTIPDNEQWFCPWCGSKIKQSGNMSRPNLEKDSMDLQGKG